MTSPAGAVLSRTPFPHPDAVAQALADAMLAVPVWGRERLIHAGNRTLGVRRRWVSALAEELLTAYPRPPVDAPRELATHIRYSEPFSRALLRATRAQQPLPLTHPSLQPRQARPAPAHIVPIPHLGALADLLGVRPGELEWFADPQHRNRRAAPRLQHYRYVWRERPGRVPRLLEVPAPRLRALQRTVLRELLAGLPLHPAAHGFVPGRSAVTGAAMHTGQAVVLTADLLSFFATVTAGRVYGILRQGGYSEAVAHRLTGLCTHRVPPRVLTGMPRGGDPAQRLALRQALALPHLPQGAPTSPTLANLAVRRLDSRLQGWARSFDAGFTRYADDLTFSGPRSLLRAADDFLLGLERIVEAEGLRLNPRKTRVSGAGGRQSVTGVVVNERTNVRRADVDRLKAILHNCATQGPAGQNRAGHPDFRAHLRGRIAWVGAVHPDRGAALLAMLERIDFG